MEEAALENNIAAAVAERNKDFENTIPLLFLKIC